MIRNTVEVKEYPPNILLGDFLFLSRDFDRARLCQVHQCSTSKCQMKSWCIRRPVQEGFSLGCKFNAIVCSQSRCYCCQGLRWHFGFQTYQYWNLSISNKIFFPFNKLSKKYHCPLHYSTSKNRILWHDLPLFIMMTSHLYCGTVVLRRHLLSLQPTAQYVPCCSRWLEAWRVNGSDYFMNSDSWSGT